MSQFRFLYHHIYHIYPTALVFKLKRLHGWLQNNDPAYSRKYIERDTYTNVLIRYVFSRPLEKMNAA